ncbi:MAG: ATP-binding cassette domain-containing protein, partial [Phycisphaerales bacterium]
AVAAGIHHALGRKPGCLSQGERQRVAICRALAHNPALVLCDEPTGNLDPDAASAVIDLLLDQVRSRDAGLLMVTHNHALLRHFDRVVHIRSAREPDWRLACLHEGAP